uniref:Uncharacterized protein n=2 Tax=Rhizophora mucronata TaxID=61149 RepID=A0A2P2IJ30_RHIMU
MRDKREGVYGQREPCEMRTRSAKENWRRGRGRRRRWRSKQPAKAKMTASTTATKGITTAQSLSPIDK